MKAFTKENYPEGSRLIVRVKRSNVVIDATVGHWQSFEGEDNCVVLKHNGGVAPGPHYTNLQSSDAYEVICQLGDNGKLLTDEKEKTQPFTLKIEDDSWEAFDCEGNTALTQDAFPEGSKIIGVDTNNIIFHFTILRWPTEGSSFYGVKVQIKTDPNTARWVRQDSIRPLCGVRKIVLSEPEEMTGITLSPLLFPVDRIFPAKYRWNGKVFINDVKIIGWTNLASTDSKEWKVLIEKEGGATFWFNAGTAVPYLILPVKDIVHAVTPSSEKIPEEAFLSHGLLNSEDLPAGSVIRAVISSKEQEIVSEVADIVIYQWHTNSPSSLSIYRKDGQPFKTDEGLKYNTLFVRPSEIRILSILSKPAEPALSTNDDIVRMIGREIDTYRVVIESPQATKTDAALNNLKMSVLEDFLDKIKTQAL